MRATLGSGVGLGSVRVNLGSIRVGRWSTRGRSGLHPGSIWARLGLDLGGAVPIWVELGSMLGRSGVVLGRFPISSQTPDPPQIDTGSTPDRPRSDPKSNPDRPRIHPNRPDYTQIEPGSSPDRAPIHPNLPKPTPDRPQTDPQLPRIGQVFLGSGGKQRRNCARRKHNHEASGFPDLVKFEEFQKDMVVQGREVPRRDSSRHAMPSRGIFVRRLATPCHQEEISSEPPKEAPFRNDSSPKSQFPCFSSQLSALCNACVLCNKSCGHASEGRVSINTAIA